MSKPALRILVDRLRAVVEGIDGAAVFTDRAPDDAYDDLTLAAINIRVTNIARTVPNGQHATLNSAQVVFDFISRKRASALPDETNQANAAAVISRIMDDFTLGGRLQDFIQGDIGSTELEAAGDVGRAILECEAQYWTPNNDLTVIIGAGGALFTD